jgi:DNA polymerase-3 subunit beta
MSSAFAMVGGVAPARSPKPILQNLKFVVDSSGSTLMATDLELGIRYAVSGVRVDEPGAVILPTSRMQQLLRLSTEIDLAIESSGDRVDVAGIRGKWHFAAEDPELFPEVPAFSARSYHVLSGADLRKLIRRTSFATDTESTRYALGGVLVEFGDETVSMVGTDGRRLAKMTVPARNHGEASIPEGLFPVIPVKALKLIERNLIDDDSPVHLAIADGNSALIRTDRAVIYSRLVEGRFPRYQDVFPNQREVRIDLKAGELLRAVQQSMIVTSDESRGVDFKFAASELTLTSKSPLGDSRLVVPIDYDDKPLEITFDPRYLVEALGTLDEDVRVSIDLVNAKTAALFHTEDRYDYIVMPLTRES